MRHKKVIFAFALTVFAYSTVQAEDAELCQSILALKEKLSTSAEALHGNDKEYEVYQGYKSINSTPKSILAGAEKCSLTTSHVAREDIRFLSFNYKCEWPQNHNSSVDSAMQMAAVLGNGISGCMKGKGGVSSYVLDKETRKEWVTNSRESRRKISFVTSSVKSTKYPRIAVEIKGTNDE